MIRFPQLLNAAVCVFPWDQFINIGDRILFVTVVEYIRVTRHIFLGLPCNRIAQDTSIR
jgi:hypothetical protein